MWGKVSSLFLLSLKCALLFNRRDLRSDGMIINWLLGWNSKLVNWYLLILTLCTACSGISWDTDTQEAVQCFFAGAAIHTWRRQTSCEIIEENKRVYIEWITISKMWKMGKYIWIILMFYCIIFKIGCEDLITCDKIMLQKVKTYKITFIDDTVLLWYLDN